MYIYYLYIFIWNILFPIVMFTLFVIIYKQTTKKVTRNTFFCKDSSSQNEISKIEVLIGTFFLYFWFGSLLVQFYSNYWLIRYQEMFSTVCISCNFVSLWLTMVFLCLLSVTCVTYCMSSNSKGHWTNFSCVQSTCLSVVFLILPKKGKWRCPS